MTSWLAIRYQPHPNFYGVLPPWYYGIGDPSGADSTATVYITVNSVLDAPVAVNDKYTIDEDTVLHVDAAGGILSNDSDDDGDSLEALLEIGPVNGILVLNFDGSFTYTPDANFFGTDSFTYRASDGILQSDITTVTITVNPVNDPPVAVNDYAELDEDTVIIIDVLANDYDVDGDPIDVLWMGGDPSAMHGTLSWYWYEAEPGVF
ncbi:MAG: Ig-like domain-containing protein, partial [Candidatus Thorarchaeota archaeon]